MSSSIPSHMTSVEMSVTFTSNASMKSSNNSSHLSVSTPTSLVSGSGMSGLLNSRNLVQDEKLAVATLATLQSGSASTLIKQDLKWIIQSRRRAEGKSEIQVEFKKPIKDELTTEEVVKRSRRRELNRLAARRSREKGQRKKDRLVEEICHLQSQNKELIHILGSLTDERNSIIDTLRQHMTECSDHTATRAAVGLPQNVLDKLGLVDRDLQPIMPEENEPFSPTSHLYICTSEDMKLMAGCHSPPLHHSAKTTQTHSFSSCPSSPMVVGFSGKPLVAEEQFPTTHATAMMHSSLNSTSPLSSSSTSSFTSSPTTPVCDPHGGSQSSSDVSQRLFPPPPLPPPPPPELITQRRRNSSHTFDLDCFHQAPDDDPLDYKFTRPASPISRPSRVLLERSFSFPSSHRESREDFPPGITSFTSSVDSERLTSPRETTGPLPLCKSDEQEVPLDLVVRNRYSSDSTKEVQTFSSCKDDRSAGRRRSVDDGVYGCNREPLNLSRKTAISFSVPNLPQESSHSKS